MASLRAKCIVFGYIRLTISATVRTPQDILDLCLLFFEERDAFDPKTMGSRMELNGHQSIKQIKRGPANCICSTVVSSGCHHWKFKIKQVRKQPMVIGIWRVDSNDALPKMNFVFSEHGQGYGYWITHGQKTSTEEKYEQPAYGQKVVNGDVVEMILDFDDWSLSYVIHPYARGLMGTIPCGKAHTVEPYRYKAAVYMSGRDEEIELVEYTRKGQNFKFF